MASAQTPDIQSQIPKIQIPINPTENSAETHKNEKKSANMEKLKDAVMKLLKTEPNSSLSEAHKAHLVEERLTQYLVLLHSPDHPPYAWMIERAIQDLNEKGGSSEESISKLIRKKYDDLPWAHDTMLKHHLVQLCESGEIVLTRDKQYLLAGADSDLKTRPKCRRKSVKRKRGWGQEKKQRKRRRKVNRKENMVQKDEDVDLLFSQPNKGQVTSNEVNEVENCMVKGIQEQKLEDEGKELLLSQRRDQVISKGVVEEEYMVDGVEEQKLKGDDAELLLCQPKNQGTSKHEEEGYMIQGIGQQKLVAELSKHTEKLHVAEENGVYCGADAPPIVAHGLPITDGKNNSEKSTVQQEISEPTAGTVDISSRNAQLKQGGKHLEDNETELSSPEMPPGFESVMLGELSHVLPQAAVSSKLPIHPKQLNQHNEHDALDDRKASGPELCDNGESIPTDRMQRQMKRWSKRLAGERASSISDILPSPKLQEECPPKLALSDQNMAPGILITPMESTMITEVQEKQCIQQQTDLQASLETLQQPNSKNLSKLPCLDRHPAEPKHRIEPLEHERKKQIAQGTQIRRILRPRPLIPEQQLPDAIIKANFSSSHDEQERKTPESQCPVTEVTNGLTISVHQNKQYLLSEEAECEPSKGATRVKGLPKHRHRKKQQIGLQRQGRPRKSRNAEKAEPDMWVVADITPSNDQNQQHNEHPPWPPVKTLDVITEDNSLLKSVHDLHLEQQVEKPRHEGHGMPPKHKRTAISMEESNLQHETTIYKGRGRPRKTDRKY